MNVYTNVLSLSDSSHRWLTSLSGRLLDVLTTSGLLISEDITLIDTLVESQLDSINYCLPQKSCLNINNKQLLAVGSVASALVWYESSLDSYRPLFVSLVCGISWKLSSILYNFINKSYMRHRFISKTRQLCQSLVSETQLLNKYFKLIEDMEAVMDGVDGDAGQHQPQHRSETLANMKLTFRRTCWSRFGRFRAETLRLRQKFPLTTGVDDHSMFLCCLPSESFDTFATAEDDSTITLSLLKSLKQLKRLQQSEFFRRFMCLFIAICYDKQTLNMRSIDNCIESVFKDIITLFNELIHESDQTYSELLSCYKCSKSLWVSSQKSLIKSRDLRQTTQSIEFMNLLNANRNIRKHLLIALNLVDECDSLIEDDGYQRHDFRHNIRQKLDSIGGEVKNLDNFVITLEKLLRIEELKESNNKLLNELEINREKELTKPMTILSLAEEYVVRDQVFEAVVTEDYDEFDNDLNGGEDDLMEYNIKLNEESAACCDNLFRELKVALKTKAAEHERREAKALGIELPIKSTNDVNDIESTSDQQLSQTVSKQMALNELSQPLNARFNDKTFSDSIHENKLLCDLNPSLAFESQIASFAAQKARDFGLSVGTESFGDESDPDSD